MCKPLTLLLTKLQSRTANYLRCGGWPTINKKDASLWKLIWYTGAAEQDEWKAVWSVECSKGSFFVVVVSKGVFLPRARSLCVRETVSFLCSKAVRDDWDLKMLSDVDEVKEGRAAYHQSLRQWWVWRTRERENIKKKWNDYLWRTR